MLSLGFFAAQWIGYGCNYSSTAFQWRFPLAFQVVPGLALAGGFPSGSPRWLMEKDRHDEAREALCLHGNGHNEEYLELEYREIHDTNCCRKTSFRAFLGRNGFEARLEVCRSILV